jgi:tungstate transport system ATP-binding protein
MKPIITAFQLKKKYDGKSVLDIDNFEVEEGRITAVIGPSGSGKTTLLSIMNGIERPDGGKVVFKGSEFSETSSYGKEAVMSMSMVFQKPVMFNTSVFNNIAYGLRARKMDKDIIKERLSEAASWVGLSDLLKQKAVTLSGGEAGRVSVARAMIVRPDILLMDEPTANLDPSNVSIIEDMIRRANKDYGTTVIIVTHNMFQARRLAHNVAFMLNGKIVEKGPAATIFDNACDKRTQDFISGNMVY